LNLGVFFSSVFWAADSLNEALGIAVPAVCGPKTSTFHQLLKETGARTGEAHSLKWTDLDFEAATVRITPEERGSCGGYLHGGEGSNL